MVFCREVCCCISWLLMELVKCLERLFVCVVMLVEVVEKMVFIEFGFLVIVLFSVVLLRVRVLFFCSLMLMFVSVW